MRRSGYTRADIPDSRYTRADLATECLAKLEFIHPLPALPSFARSLVRRIVRPLVALSSAPLAGKSSGSTEHQISAQIVDPMVGDAVRIVENKVLAAQQLMQLASSSRQGQLALLESDSLPGALRVAWSCIVALPSIDYAWMQYQKHKCTYSLACSIAHPSHTMVLQSCSSGSTSPAQG